MKERIRQLMESKHMTQQTFAAYVGMSAAALSSIFNERTRPTLNTVEAIKSKMPEVSVDWLIFGTGDMLVSAGDGDGGGEPPVGADGVAARTFFTDADGTPVARVGGGRQSAVADMVGAGLFANRPLSAGAVAVAERPVRRVTEIRVFYDDSTYESFVPGKDK